MRKAFLAVVVVFLMIVSMLAVASALPGNVIPAKNGSSPIQPHGYDRSGLQTSSSSAQSVTQAKPSTNSGANKLDLLLHNYNVTAESPIQSNLVGSYKVTFTETGLPAGMPWQVTVENSSFPVPPIFGAFFNMSLGIVSSSSGTSISVSLANGSYVYYTGPASTDLGPYYFNVTGAPTSIDIPFPAFYKVTFAESGLPSGMPWNVISFNNSSTNAETPFYFNISSSSSMVACLPNGTYAFLAGPRSTYLFQKGFTVIGRSLSPSVVFPAFYTVTFTEVNLPSGEPWFLMANSTSPSSYYVLYFNASNTVSKIAYLPTGGYNYRASENIFGIFSGPSVSGVFTVNTAPETVKVIFPVTYKITFTEKNLPEGADWSVSASNYDGSVYYYNTSSGSSMITYLLNGTYNYSGFWSSGGLSTPEREFNVTGAPLNLTVIFPVTYKITFTEENLPAGADWSVHAFDNNYSINYYNASSGSTKIAFLQNGTYNYTGSFSGVATPEREFNVTGAPLNLTVIFPVTYKITFTEENLPAGANWSVRASNSGVYYYNFSSGSSMIAYFPNGTYHYFGYFNGVTTPYHEFNVTGAPLNLTVIFPVTYKITFTEENLPAGAYWNTNAYNYNSSVSYYNTSFRSSMIAYLPNGTYNYSGSWSSGGLSTPYREFNVTGFPMTRYVVFPEAYSVVFTETGLPTGTTWYVSVYNSTTGHVHNSSSTSTITFSLYNGSYTYTVTTSLSGWKPSSSSGSFNVSGSPVNVPTITFSTTDHSVQFKESGLLTGTSWYVILNATEETSTSNNITFYVPNGNYSYTLETPVPGSPGTRYVVSPSSGTVTVSGSNVSENVFYSTQYYLTTGVSPAGTGTVSPSSSWFSAGSSVTLTAKAVSGYAFSSWSGSGTGSYTGTNNPSTLTMSGPVSETANFIQANVTHTPPIWAFDGAYLNLSFSITNNSGTTHGYTYYKIVNVYNTNETVYVLETLKFGSNTSVNSYQYFSWNSFPFAVNASMLSDLNSGVLGTQEKANVSFTTSMGTFKTDEISYASSISNATEYIDMHAGVVVALFQSNSTSKIKLELVSTNVPTTVVVEHTIYTITFTESGLPSGTSWTMTFNGVTNSSTNSVMTFSAPNGTYSFSASNLSDYYTVNYSGSISVKGNGVSIPIIYYHYAYISGTVTPHNATVDINGHSVSVTGSGLYNASETSGTYSIVVSESGYITYYNNVTLTSGQTKELNVTLNPVKTTPVPSSFPSLELYGIVGAVVAIIAVVAVISVMRKKH